MPIRKAFAVWEGSFREGRDPSSSEAACSRPPIPRRHASRAPREGRGAPQGGPGASSPGGLASAGRGPRGTTAPTPEGPTAPAAWARRARPLRSAHAPRAPRRPGRAGREGAESGGRGRPGVRGPGPGQDESRSPPTHKKKGSLFPPNEILSRGRGISPRSSPSVKGGARGGRTGRLVPGGGKRGRIPKEGERDFWL